VHGKFIYVGEEKLYIRGVTYGPFRPGADGSDYRDPDPVNRDFESMSRAGVNAVRTYTVPPRWLLDCAHRHGLRILVGLPWEQHVAFLSDRSLSRDIESRVRSAVRSCARHPALLGFAIGNEVPSSVVRWHGHRRVERHIERLYRAAKDEDPDALVAYVNYPSTEYLELPFVDLVSFNVYLESQKNLDAYLLRLHNIAGNRPLVLAETGLDSRRNGLDAQARALSWQIATSYQAACAGVFVFAWTDEWHRNNKDVDDWDFGLTRRDRSEKPSLAATRDAFARIPFHPDQPWPRISVVICACQGILTLRDCLAGLRKVQYPAFEVIVVNDGSGEVIQSISEQFRVRLINIPRSGLSAARNVGLQAAAGEIVAYLDDDAHPDPHWLQYLAHTFMTTDFAAVGGPNIPPPTRDHVVECLAHAPGGPVHVLLSDTEAEHIPGCNMAFRKTALQIIGGFDPQFRAAGDDVDICWRITDAGMKIGFNPGAMVWHHRRRTVRTYWRQQVGYGKAEALLERKWPAKYNAAGHPGWRGRIYGTERPVFLSLRRARIYHGTWGTALFQSIYEPAPNHLWSLAQMPEWYFVILLLAVAIVLGPLWKPLILAVPLLALAVAIPVAQSTLNACRALLDKAMWPRRRRLRMRALIAGLHLMQPLARLWGRVGAGLTPWRRRVRGFAIPYPRAQTIWSEQWRSPTEWIESVEAPLKMFGATVYRGGDFDRWDLEVRSGCAGSVRLRMLIEEHGSGKQLVRATMWPRWPMPMALTFIIAADLAAGAAVDGALGAARLLGAIAVVLLVTTITDWAASMDLLLRVLQHVKSQSEIADLPAEAPAAAPADAVPEPGANP
jgi:GT2 family glycosyltransferase